MEHATSLDEMTVMHQLDCMYQLVLGSEATDFLHIGYHKKYEINFLKC